MNAKHKEFPTATAYASVMSNTCRKTEQEYLQGESESNPLNTLYIFLLEAILMILTDWGQMNLVDINLCWWSQIPTAMHKIWNSKNEGTIEKLDFS